MTDHSLRITFSQWDAMCRHVVAQAPLEACGLLSGKNGSVENVFLVTNIARSPVRFRMEPKAQLSAFAQIETSGQEILAIFHSHPNGSSVPSPTDIKEAAYPVVYIIWSPTGQKWHARGFWIEKDCAAEVLLDVQGV